MRQPRPTGPDEDRWTATDRYLAQRLIPNDPTLDAVLAANGDAGLPEIAVSPLQGRLLALLVQIAGARRVLEVGTLGGYSTVHMARALPPGGTVTTIEIDPRHAEVAGGNFARAGLSDRIEQHVGPAAEVLPTLTGPFDLVFIDADKPGNPVYLRQAIALSRSGTVIVVDNVVRRGGIIDAGSPDANVIGVQQMLDRIAAEPGVTATAVQTVGEKGWDGFMLLRVD